MKDVIEILKSVGAILTNDHFVYTSGKHGSVYVNKDALYPHTELSSQIGEMFAKKHRKLGIDVVCAPALGGIILSQWTAFHLSRLAKREILGVYTEKDEHKNQVFTRGYESLIVGKNVLVIEDLTTTGGSVKKVVDTVRGVGGRVVAVGVMVNRNVAGVNEKLFEVPFSALGVLPVEAYEPSSCALCKDHIPINTAIGHGRAYVEALRSNSH